MHCVYTYIHTYIHTYIQGINIQIYIHMSEYAAAAMK